MLGADKNISDDIAKKLTESIKNGNAKDFKEIMGAYGSREMAWNSGAPKAMIDALELKGNKSERDLFLKDKLEIKDNDSREKILKFFEDPNKKALHNDTNKKELMSLMNSGRSG